jgi:uncharacterized membrane protein
MNREHVTWWTVALALWLCSPLLAFAGLAIVLVIARAAAWLGF